MFKIPLCKRLEFFVEESAFLRPFRKECAEPPPLASATTPRVVALDPFLELPLETLLNLLPRRIPAGNEESVAVVFTHRI